MSRNRFLHRNNGIRPAPKAWGKIAFFVRSNPFMGAFLVGSATGLGYNQWKGDTIEKGSKDREARNAQMIGKIVENNKKVQKTTNSFSKENQKTVLEIYNKNINKTQWSKGKKHVSLVEELEEGLKREGKEHIRGEKNFDTLMEHLRAQDAELKVLEGIWVEHKEHLKELDLFRLKCMGIGLGVGLPTLLILSVVEKIIITQRAKKRSEDWKAAKEKKALEKKEANEERARIKKEKKKRKEEEKQRAREMAAEERKRKAAPAPVKEEDPKKRNGITKNELKGRVAEVLKPELGEDAERASKLLLKFAGKEVCKRIMDEPEDKYEIIGEQCGENKKEDSLGWILDKVSGSDEEETPEMEERDGTSYDRYGALELGLPKEVENGIEEKGLDVESVKMVIIYGFSLHKPKRAIGRLYRKTNFIKRDIDNIMRYWNHDPGKEREDILDFLKSHGVVSTYKRGGKCMMINTVPSLGQAQPVTETGEKILKAIVDWVIEFKKHHQA